MAEYNMKEIWVFASNLAGKHGAGSALHAKRFYGAKYGIGIGMQGDSYAIPTKDKNLKVMPLKEIEHHVKDFLSYAKKNEDLAFNVVKIGCGLAGYKPEEIAPMFEGYSENVKLPKEFIDIIG